MIERHAMLPCNRTSLSRLLSVKQCMKLGRAHAGVLASDTTKTRLQCGTFKYWVVVLSVVPFILLLAAGVRAYLLRKYHVKARYGWEWTEGDVQWNERATLIYPAVCSLAGLVAGLFGIGGGVIKVGASFGSICCYCSCELQERLA